MNEKIQDREQLLSMLTEAVSHVTNFFTQTDGALFDGHQTARQVLSHLVFWLGQLIARFRTLESILRVGLACF